MLAEIFKIRPQLSRGNHIFACSCRVLKNAVIHYYVQRFSAVRGHICCLRGFKKADEQQQYGKGQYGDGQKHTAEKAVKSVHFFLRNTRNNGCCAADAALCILLRRLYYGSYSGFITALLQYNNKYICGWKGKYAVISNNNEYSARIKRRNINGNIKYRVAIGSRRNHTVIIQNA